MSETACLLFKRGSVSFSTLEPLVVSPVGFLSRIFWELVSLVQTPGAGLPDVGSPPLTLWEKCPSGDIPLYCVPPCWGWGYWGYFSASPTHLDVVLFLLCCGAGVPLASSFFSGGIDPYVAVHLL